MSEFDAMLFDLDGVVYVGPDAVPHAAEVIADARASGIGCGFVTNNASRTAEAVAEHLTAIGVAALPEEVITSPQAAVRVLGEYVPLGSRVLVIGGPGIEEELVRGGYVPVRSMAERPAAIMQGFSPDLTWRDLAEATYAVRSGLPWIATNLDFTFPTPSGPAPGNGSLVRMVAEVVGREPNVAAGKPEPPLLHEAIARLGAGRPLMVGDRLDTDIDAGARVGIPTLLVMTGVCTPRELLTATGSQRPTFVGADLRVLLRPYGDVATSVTAQEARCSDSVASIESSGGLALSGALETMDIVRATAALCWSIADRGREVDVEPVIPVLQDAISAELDR